MGFNAAGDAFGRALAARSPRFGGAVFMLLGLLLLGMNAALIAWKQQFYSLLFVVGGVTTPIGFWWLVTGRAGPRDGAGPERLPLWWQLGFYFCMFGGLGAGIALAVWCSG